MGTEVDSRRFIEAASIIPLVGIPRFQGAAEGLVPINHQKTTIGSTPVCIHLPESPWESGDWLEGSVPKRVETTFPAPAQHLPFLTVSRNNPQDAGKVGTAFRNGEWSPRISSRKTPL